ncbi:MAG: hypothetical protein RMI04_04195 [Thermofilaceae archaeon]|nr:hypothetical protein [Thermofilaceae archaeon]
MARPTAYRTTSRAMGLLAGTKTEPEKPREEEFPMSSDYVGGPEGWAKLSIEEKKAIVEGLKHGRKLYISLPTFEGKRGELDSEILQAHRLKRILSG